MESDEKDLLWRRSRLLLVTPRYVKRLADQKIIPYVALPGHDRIFDREKVVEALSRFEVRAVGTR